VDILFFLKRLWLYGYLVLENGGPYTQILALFIRGDEEHGDYMDILLLQMPTLWNSFI